MPKIRISILSAIWFIYLMISNTSFIIPLICAVVLHEAGHIVLAIILKIKICSIDLSILGARIKTQKTPSYIDELLFSLGGPLFGFLGFLFTYKIALIHNFLFPFSILSLCLSIFNLLPLSSLDGERILKCIFCITFSIDIAEKITKSTSFLTLIILWLLSVYMMIRMANGLPMFIFCLIFFSKCFVFNKKNADFESI